MTNQPPAPSYSQAIHSRLLCLIGAFCRGRRQTDGCRVRFLMGFKTHKQPEELAFCGRLPS